MRTDRARIAARTLVTALAGLLLVVLAATGASAHAELARSDPRSGGSAAVGRTAMTLWFTESVDVRPADLRLATLDGVEVPVTVRSAPGTTVDLAVPPLTRGTYVLDWHAVSLDDGHASSGSVLFGVGLRPAVGPSGTDGRPAPDGYTLRWLDLTALLLVGGSLTVAGSVLGGPTTPPGVQRRARLVGAWAAGAAVVAGAVAPVLLTRSGGDSFGVRLRASAELLTGTTWGHLWLVREAALVVVLAAVVRWSGAGTGRRARTVGIAALAAALWCDASAGHAASLPARSAVAALATAGHVAAACVWAGGLAVVAGCLVPTLWRDRAAHPVGPTLAAVLRAFSPVAAVAAAALLATGVYAAARQVPDLHALTSTTYGAAVLAKVGLLALALGLAAMNTLLVRGPLAARLTRTVRRPAGWAPVPVRRLPVLVAAEVGVLALAVATAALLTSVPTAREAADVEHQSYLHAAHVDGLFITLEDVPAGATASRVVVRVRSTVRPEVAPVDAVEVLLEGPSGVSHLPLALVEPGRWDASGPALAPGAWSATVAVQRGALPIATTQVVWDVAAPPGDGVGPLEAAAGGLAVVLLLATVLGVALARRRPAPVEPEVPPVPATAGRLP